MTERIATTTGLFPLPDHAKSTLSDLKGHQKDDLISGDEGDDIVEEYDRVRAEVVERQRAAGLDRIVEGQLRWDDMLAHPLCVHENVETRGIVRYYDNNNFYREPVVRGDLSFSGDVASDLEKTAALAGDEALQAVLPGPYSLADLATDEHYGDEAAFLDAVADFLVGEVEAFPEVETLLLLEPSLVEHAPGDGTDARASEAIDRVAGATDADVIVHAFYGALTEKVHAHLLDADVDAVGYDFVNDHDRNLYNINEYGTTDDVALGFVDGQNTKVESSDLIRERVEWVEESTPGASFERTYLLPNTETFYLPVNRFEEKLDALGAAVAEEEVTA
ncbi:5-methyltetrahydropteroyltriglutamate--homocysteine methyltransferase [Halomarina halobia]|uniref:5-methyltetrahydropteroyltriglutamate--homocysteine methyltransferase n=1 Tax=Halomarina halobia TaxID=3033386 RepID=A0ABD6A567_9EURY|nr:5-methyltetrahydropteroyltriglutamate--homocysteine methyltransferase [Halomarina sp. PSR21]